MPSTAEILDRIKSWKSTAAGRPLKVAFFGGTFTALPVATQLSLLQPLQPLLQNGVIESVTVSTRPDCVEEKHINLLASLGVRTVELGVQSMDDNVLEASERGHKSADAVRAIALVRKAGVRVGAQLLPGLPGDSHLKSLDSLDRVAAAGADFLRIYPAVVIRDTELARLYLSGAYTPLSLEDGISLCKKMLQKALKLSLPVLRIGLQPDSMLESSVLAGCWHPAFGQLVRARLYADLLERYVFPGSCATIRCNRSHRSDVAGVATENIRLLKERGVTLRIDSDDRIEPWTVEVEVDGIISNYSIINDICY